MTAEEKVTLTKMLATCRKAFSHSQADSETISLYVQALDELTISEAKAALIKCMKTVDFFPTIAQILRAAESVKTTATGSKKPDAGEAWKEAIDNVRKIGCYGQWKYSCREVELACQRFGINELINLEEGAVNTARAQFTKIYNAILERSKEEQINKQVLITMGPAAKVLEIGA